MKPMTADYTAMSRSQQLWVRDGMQDFSETCSRAVASHSDASVPFRVLEWGCATGINSVVPIKEIRRLLGDAATLSIAQCDLPENNWAEVFKVAREQLVDDKTVHEVIGRSFYEELVPDASVDFLFTFASVHWSRKSIALPINATREEHARWLNDQAEESYSSFDRLVSLALDALKPGGTAFFSFVGESSEEYDPSDFEAVALYGQTWRQLMSLTNDQLRLFFCSQLVRRPLSHIKKCLETHRNDCTVITVGTFSSPKIADDVYARISAEGLVTATYDTLGAQAKAAGFPDVPSKTRLVDAFAANIDLYFSTRGYRPRIPRTVVSFQKTLISK